MSKMYYVVASIFVPLDFYAAFDTVDQKIRLDRQGRWVGLLAIAKLVQIIFTRLELHFVNW